MVAGEKKIKLRDRGKNEKGERKMEENYITNGGKGLKNASLWVINSKIFAGGSSNPPCTPPWRPGKKKWSKKRGGGK